MMFRLIAAALLLLVARSAMAQLSPLERGDVLASTLEGTPQGVVTKVVVYSSSGVRKGELTTSLRDLRETLYRNGVVYVATETGIERIQADGQRAPFSGSFNSVWLAPAADGNIFAANGSGEIYQVGTTGGLRLMLEAAIENNPAHGLDLAPDQCTIYYAGSGRAVVWNICNNTDPVGFGHIYTNSTLSALRLRADGTFILSYLSDVFQVDQSGSITRAYGIPSRGIALDVDGTSFWAGAGSTLLKVDVATGGILVRAELGPNIAIRYLSVVDEPRAGLAGVSEIPTTNGWTLLMIGLSLAVIAAVRLR